MSLVSMTSADKARSRTEKEQLEFLLRKIAKEDKDALTELYHLTSPSVYGFALSIVKNMDDAEDVLHDTYLRIYSSAGRYKCMGKPLAWILTITRNLSLMKLRDRKKTADLPEADWNSAFASLPAVTVEDRLMLTASMEKLSDEERQIVMLHAVSGFKHREIAEVLKLPLSTVLSKYRRTIKKLRVLLSEGESQ